ncbi:MAG: hypothetical protein GX491_07905 [Chloroflexi bacterium]|nr:hypothetical protein [Chloroflexota bacterium]
MKRVKVTKQKQREFTLRPSRLRMFVIYLVLFVFAYGFGILLRLIFNNGAADFPAFFDDWYLDAGIVVGGAFVLALVDFRRWTVRIMNGDQLEGPAGPFGERLAVPLRNIDWTRSTKSLKAGLGMANGIYTIDRQRVLFNRWFYAPNSLQEFFDRIGFRG